MDTSDRVTPATGAGSGRLGSAATSATSPPSTSAKQLRRALVDHLSDQGTLCSPRVEAALRAVPRHIFVPAVAMEDAYADRPLYTKHDDAGVSISAASQPTIVAMMLQQLDVQAGHTVLEIGAGTGYNAALLAYLTGTTGQVTTIDLDQDLVDGARAALAAAGYAQVRAVRGDGVLGDPAGASYDRIVATVGAHGVPPAWLAQLGPDGRLVVPLRLRGSVSRSVVFEREGAGRWLSVGSDMCTFMPLRGIAQDARRTIPLTAHETVCLEVHHDQVANPSHLTEVLRQRRVTAWTGVTFAGMESMEWLYLWLACAMPNAISRMPVERAAVDQGLVDPQFGWGAMATFEHGNLAYLTVRRHEPPAGEEPRHEIGLIGHGPDGDILVDRLVQAVRAWNRSYRSATVDFEIQRTAPDEHTDDKYEDAKAAVITDASGTAATGVGADAVSPPAGRPARFAIDTPLNRIAVTWR